MSFLAPPTFDEPIDIGPEPSADPPPGMQAVMNLSRIVHLRCLVERARRALDEATLYAQSRVYDDDLTKDFDLCEQELRAVQETVKSLHKALTRITQGMGVSLAAQLGSSRVTPPAGAPGVSGGGVSPPSVSSGRV
jgi:hypothetical protein